MKARFLSALSFCVGIMTALAQSTIIEFAQSRPYVVPENAENVTLGVQRLGESGTAVTVTFATIDGTAMAGLKYMTTTGALTFAPGETNKEITVSLVNDGIVGATQDFHVVLSNPVGGAVLGAQADATVRIMDNDKGLQFEFGSYAVREDEGSVLIGVTRGDDGDFPVTLNYATVDNTAISGRDYTGATSTLTFAAGETSLYNHSATTSSIWFIIANSLHEQFNDYYWRDPSNLKNGREIARTINDWTVWFLNKHVRGLNAPMPDLKDYPSITSFKQK